MKLISIYFTVFLLLICLSSNLFGQTTTMNYIHTFEIQVAGVIDPLSLDINTPMPVALQTIQYFNGLGRPLQVVQKSITPQGYDMVKPFIYNNVGLDDINYEPYVANSSTGEYRSTFEIDQPNFYANLFGDLTGRSPIEYEKSPLNRVIKQGAPGASWQLSISNGGHPIQYAYLSNNTSDLKAVLWKATGTTCSTTGNYAINQLYITKTIDEGGSETYEFKDKQGHVVLKRAVLDSGINVDTYYVYDDFGMLRVVISPEGTVQLSSNNISSFDALNALAKRFVYFYTYDERKRLVEKQIPGKEPEYYVYDKTDKVVMYQDGNMRKTKADNTKAYEWMFTKYDAMGRVILTGITRKYPGLTRAQVQGLANSATQCWEYLNGDENMYYYSNGSFPTYESTYCSILSINYYDTYHVWKQNGSNFEKISLYNDNNLDCSLTPDQYNLYKPELNHLTGFATVNYTSIFYSVASEKNPDNLFATTTYYDIRGRVLQTHSKNHCNGYDHYTNLYKGITNLVIATQHRHTTQFTALNDVSESIANTYDAAGRLSSKSYYFQDIPPKQVITNTYNTLGRLITKQIGDEISPLQTVDYQYNIRGWLTRINDPSAVSSTGDLFGMELLYNITNNELHSGASYTGNISAIKWQTVQPTGITTPPTNGQKAYAFGYDKLNRLKFAAFSEYQNNSTWSMTNKYSENIQSYDLNGNIQALNRFGLRAPNNLQNTIDELTYSYDGNRLIAVDDAVSTNNIGDFMDNGHYYKTTHEMEYAYDANGNLIKDDNKGIVSIKYNTLNLPASITKTDGNRIEYIYDADGNKLCQLLYVNGSISKTTDFIGNFVYENGQPAYIIYDEGRIVFSSGNRTFAEGFLKDHLGNVRVVFRRENGILKTRQVNSFYPFGMNIKGLCANSIDVIRPNEYFYNSKMFQDEMGLNWLDYGARFYDPVLGRWQVIDNKAELYFGRSSYVYALNTPVIATDPDGSIVIFINGNHYGDGAKGYVDLFGRLGDNWRGTSDYWSKSGFNIAVMNQLGDHNAIYRDGALGGFAPLNHFTGGLIASARKNQGYAQGKSDAEKIIASLARDKEGNIIESIKVITHSMGSAYGKGFVKALKEYIKTMPKEQQKQILISLVADFDPFQAGDIEADPDIKTEQFKHFGNSNILGMGWLANEDEKGLTGNNIHTNTGTSTDHSITSFINDISKLEEGTYKWDGNKWVKQ